MRKENWDVILENYIRVNRDRIFRWGHFDCCLFAAGAIDAMTDSKFSDALAGTYLTPDGAMKRMLKMGFHDVFSAAKKWTGYKEVDLRSASRGDICGHAKTAMYPLGMLGVVYGHLVLFPGDEGLKSVRLDALPNGSNALEVL
jgi:hypothetical protein